MSAKRRLQLDQPHATAIIAVGIGTRDAGLEGPPLAWRHVIGDTFARKARAEVESGLAQIFIRRRQAHEALIHRVDAELTAGQRTPLDPALSADGVGEALRVMYGGLPAWGTFTPADGLTLRLRATDTGDSWFLTLGQFTGTDPDDGTDCDEPDLHAADSDPGTEAAAEVTGTAADLDCWLWHRPTFAAVEKTGDQQVLGRLEETIAPGIN